MNKTAALTALVLVLTGVPAFAQTTATVVRLGDGDTLRVMSQGKVVTIQMACIDAPETGQRLWGQQSAAKLKQLLPPGKAVQIREIERDSVALTCQFAMDGLSLN
ncbi:MULTISPECIES: thermonuclease family protein [Cyanophyceae]|uniref:thermonuclease family protein n=1 Tax=Cyanophyceae TaxID=3028117 RepID=UPI00168878B2|nr:thermonuclease family protein [Trichocoleus sp. FACHB-69]MBD1933307.1 thermonuclease family protein [Trichocoleus sp. FACHB-69]